MPTVRIFDHAVSYSRHEKSDSCARSALAAIAVIGAALLSGCSLFGEAPAGETSAKTIRQEPVPERCPSPSPRIASRSTRRTDIVGVVQITSATKEDTLSDIARRFNVGYEEIVRANPGVDPWLPGEGREIVVPIAVHPAERAARRHRHQRRRDAPLLLPQGEEGRAAGRVHATRSASARWAGRRRRRRPRSCAGRRIPPGVRPRPSSRSTKENGEKLDAVVGPGPDNPLGRYAFYLGWPTLPDPRHEQAGRRGPALEPRLHPPVSRGHRAAVRDWCPSARRCAW